MGPQWVRSPPVLRVAARLGRRCHSGGGQRLAAPRWQLLSSLPPRQLPAPASYPPPGLWWGLCSPSKHGAARSIRVAAAGAAEPQLPGGAEEEGGTYVWQEQWEGAGRYNYKAVIEYDGTDYKGFQAQLGPRPARTVQGEVEAALCKITGSPRELFKIQSAGRTDAGVHAEGQVIHFRIDEEKAARSLKHSLNGLLPFDIRVLEVTRVPADFNARYNALRKVYHYYLHTDDAVSPFNHRFRWHVRFKEPLDTHKMREAAALMVGRHDWTAFTSANKGDQRTRRNPVREMYRVDVVEVARGLRVEIEGDGFLYHQVRNMVGALVRVGSGKLEPSAIPALIASRDRRVAPTGAVAQGLFLHYVDYPPHGDPETPVRAESLRQRGDDGAAGAAGAAEGASAGEAAGEAAGAGDEREM